MALAGGKEPSIQAQGGIACNTIELLNYALLKVWSWLLSGGLGGQVTECLSYFFQCCTNICNLEPELGSCYVMLLCLSTLCIRWMRFFIDLESLLVYGVVIEVFS